MTTETRAKGALAPEALEQLFTAARTHNGWLPKEVPNELLELAVDYAKWGPTSANCSPMRIVFVRSPEAKARLCARHVGGQSRKNHGCAGHRDHRLRPRFS